MRNAGKIVATSGNTASSAATAIDIAAGASLPVLRNSGEIKDDRRATERRSPSSTSRARLALIENSGTISASGAAATSNRNVAIDLSANTSGATIKQTAVAPGFAAPSIIGDIHLGTGSDTLDVADGKLAGNVTFGAGDNRFLLSGDAVAAGNLSFGSGVDTITTGGTSVFNGAVDFGGGADTLTIGGTSSFTAQRQQFVGPGGQRPEGHLRRGQIGDDRLAQRDRRRHPGRHARQDARRFEHAQRQRYGNFRHGLEAAAECCRTSTKAEGHFVVLNAGTLTGGNNLTTTTELLPFLYKGALTVTGNQVAVDISRKTSTELGLNRSESAAYGAIYDALADDDDIGDSFLAIRNQEDFVGHSVRCCRTMPAARSKR